MWLVMTTGMRRGEVCALRWRDIDLEGETIEIRRNYILHRGVGVEKDTKTHQMRRIALDSETVALLREHRERVRARVGELDVELTGQMFVFSSERSLTTVSRTHRTRCRAGIRTWRTAGNRDAPPLPTALLCNGTTDCGR